MGTAVTKKIAASDVDKPLKLTKKLMNQYRESLVMRGYGKQTISMYSCYLNRLYAFLPGEKELTDENLKQWVKSLKDQGYSDRTVNQHIFSVNGLLRFCGEKSAAVSVISVPRSADTSELTRDEYLQLLKYVKENGSERDYLMIKTLATIDIMVKDLSLLTVDACQKGSIELPNNREAVIPDSLKQELLSYIEEKGYTSGPVFVTSNGNQLHRSNITHIIEKYDIGAGLDQNKSNPRALHSLYERTQKEITQHLMSCQMQEYDKLLREEQKKLG